MINKQFENEKPRFGLCDLCPVFVIMQIFISKFRSTFKPIYEDQNKLKWPQLRLKVNNTKPKLKYCLPGPEV